MLFVYKSVLKSIAAFGKWNIIPLLAGIAGRFTQELTLSRVYNPDSAGKERNTLTRGVVLALRELMKQTEANELTYDLTAFIAMSLFGIGRTIDTSVEAWEKRGYWVKADKFRLEWEWANLYAAQMREALVADDWAKVAATAARTAQKFGKINVPARNRLGTPWVGAWKEFKKAA